MKVLLNPQQSLTRNLHVLYTEIAVFAKDLLMFSLGYLFTVIIIVINYLMFTEQTYARHVH